MTPIDPPEDFLQIEENNYRHIFDSGIKDGIPWLTSNRLAIESALELIAPPKPGLRILAKGRELGLPSKAFELSDVVVERWPDINFCANFFVLPSDFKARQLLLVNQELTDFFYSVEARPAYSEDELLWYLMAALKPLFHFATQFQGLSMATADSNVITKVLNSDRFLSAESEEFERLREQRIYFWQTVGPECGPEQCIETDCKRLRVKVALRCITHQYQWGEATGLKAFEHMI